MAGPTEVVTTDVGDCPMADRHDESRRRNDSVQRSPSSWAPRPAPNRPRLNSLAKHLLKGTSLVDSDPLLIQHAIPSADRASWRGDWQSICLGGRCSAAAPDDDYRSNAPSPSPRPMKPSLSISSSTSSSCSCTAGSLVSRYILRTSSAMSLP